MDNSLNTQMSMKTKKTCAPNEIGSRPTLTPTRPKRKLKREFTSLMSYDTVFE